MTVRQNIIITDVFLGRDGVFALRSKPVNYNNTYTVGTRLDLSESYSVVF